MKRRPCFLFIIACVELPPLTLTSGALPGTLDESFAGTGKVISSSGLAFGNGIAIQSDGKIVAVGGFGNDALIVRHNPDGSLDTTFNGTGKLSGKFARNVTRNYFTGVILQNNGQILAAGTAHFVNPIQETGGAFILVRRNSDGTEDQATAVSMWKNECRAAALQNDGKIILSGLVRNDFGVRADFALARLDVDVSQDFTFNGPGAFGGWVRTDFTSRDDWANSVAIQSDGKIIAAGFSQLPIATTFEPALFALARYHSDGSLDTSFNGTGKVEMHVTAGSDKVWAMALQSDGKIVVAGQSISSDGGSVVILARYNPDGSLDASFNNSGTVTTAVGTYAVAKAVVIQADGRIVVVGASDDDYLVARYYGNGALEGFVKTDYLNNSVDEARAVALQQDGKIVVAGKASASFTILRYLPGDAAVPFGEIAVEQPSGVNLLSGTAVADYGPVVPGSDKSVTFTIRNQGAGNLTGLAATKAASGTPGDFLIGPLDTTVAPGAGTTFTVTFSPTGAGTRTATLQIASNDPDENPFVINLTGTQATPSEAWRQAHFGSPYNTGAGADLNDADRDGIVNILEYATATDPLVSAPFPGELVKNGNVLEFTYTRRKSAVAEMSFVREFSETLTGAWSQVGGTVETILSDDGVLQQVKTTVPAGSTGRRFVRLRVTRL